MGFHAIEPILPNRNVLVDPRLGRLKCVWLDLAGSNASNLLGTDEPAVLKNTHVFEQRWQRQIKRVGEFAHGFRSVAQTTDDRSSGRIGKRGKRPVQIGGILSHLGKYTLAMIPIKGKLSLLANFSGSGHRAVICSNSGGRLGHFVSPWCQVHR